jgi:hypothetical protein
MSFRSDVQTYVNKYWDVPCDDGVVESIPYTQLLQTARQGLRRSGEDPAQWKPVFLRNYNDHDGTPQCAAGCTSEELYLIRQTLYPTLGGVAYDKDRIGASDKVFLQGWKGLLDCAHYVSRCLSAGGVAMNTGYVPTLVSSLRNLRDTRTLGMHVAKAKAQNILNTGIMKTGDVIAYAHHDQHYYHSAVYMGSGQISCHTMSRSPSFDGAWYIHPTDYLYTLIHFTQGDTNPATLGSRLAGWWEVVWRGRSYFYYYEANGKVRYTTARPASTSQTLHHGESNGYWFDQGSGQFVICWTSTGSVEQFRLDAGGTSQQGKWDGVEPLSGTKL